MISTYSKLRNLRKLRNITYYLKTSQNSNIQQITPFELLLNFTNTSKYLKNKIQKTRSLHDSNFLTSYSLHNTTSQLYREIFVVYLFDKGGTEEWGRKIRRASHGHVVEKINDRRLCSRTFSIRACVRARAHIHIHLAYRHSTTLHQPHGLWKLARVQQGQETVSITPQLDLERYSRPCWPAFPVVSALYHVPSRTTTSPRGTRMRSLAHV